ncbi:STAS domain-containing protein [Methanochimaera problematica]|nr:STAS domain-containing protein [Methanoplanus sp. FWC-SCC4]
MDIITERKEGVLIFSLEGRLDTNGAELFGSAVKNMVHSDDKAVVIDLKDVPYISSSGIRVILGLKKEMKKREGEIVLCSLQEYPSKVLDMAGLLNIFKTTDSVDEGIKKAKTGIDTLSLIDELKNPSTLRNGVHYTFESGIVSKNTIFICGDAESVFNSSVTEENISEGNFDIEYSFGLGAMGIDKKDAMQRLGEMLMIQGTIIWLPTDGSTVPDYFTPVKSTGDIVFYSAQNVILNGSFADIITFETEREEGISIKELYEEIFSFAFERQRNCNGVISVVISGVIDEYYGSRIKRSPVLSNSPHPKGRIDDAENVSEWFKTDITGSYAGDTIISAGIGIDLKNPKISVYDPSTIDSLRYSHPGDLKGDTIIQTHAAVVKGISWDKKQDIKNVIRELSESGEIIDVSHLLSKTKLRKGKVGVSYPEKIIVD